mgnify:CR=1 FL=1
MDIIDFYKQLSNILEMRGESDISQRSAETLLKDLNDKAKEANLDVNISTDILNNLGKFNDERSLQIDEDSSYSY